MEEKMTLQEIYETCLRMQAGQIKTFELPPETTPRLVALLIGKLALFTPEQGVNFWAETVGTHLRVECYKDDIVW